VSNPFDGPVADDAAPASVDVHVYLVAIFLLIGAFPLLLFAVLAPFVMAFDDDPEFVAMGLVGRTAIGCIEAVLLGAIGAVQGMGGIGLLTRWKWGWVAALVAFGFTFTGCCAPVGLYAYWALLREPVRKVYGFG
jgi:hypothetical protein